MAASTNPLSPAYTPEIWATEGIAFLRENLVMARLIHRDFEDDLAQYGDTVHTRRPVELTVQDWSPSSGGNPYIEEQNPPSGTSGAAGWPNWPIGTSSVSANVELLNSYTLDIVLNKLKYTSFLIEDHTRAISFKDIMADFVQPAVVPLARLVDTDIITEFKTGTDYQAATVASSETTGASSGTLDEQDIVDARKVLNDQLCPMDSRRLVLHPTHEADLLMRDLFVMLIESGSWEALVNATLGRKFGFDVYTTQNLPDGTPATDESLAFTKRALALVTRPLPAPRGGLGALAATQSLDGVSLRVVTTYSAAHKGTIVSFDILYGVQLLDAACAVKVARS